LSADASAPSTGDEDAPSTEVVADAIGIDAGELEAFVDRAEHPTAAAVLGFAVADSSNRPLVGRWLAARGGEGET
jgi:hypothetical protein